MNRNYERGRAKEYRIMNKLKKEGYDIVARTAGSHSKIDVFGINKNLKKITLIQSKPKSLSSIKKNEIEKELNWLKGKFKIEFRVI